MLYFVCRKRPDALFLWTRYWHPRIKYGAGFFAFKKKIQKFLKK